MRFRQVVREVLFLLTTFCIPIFIFLYVMYIKLSAAVFLDLINTDNSRTREIKDSSRGGIISFSKFTTLLQPHSDFVIVPFLLAESFFFGS